MNKLFYADNLDFLKELNQKHDKPFIDLIYIDPPFNSKRDYNILYENESNNKDNFAQELAFRDTWSNYDYKEELQELKYNNIKLYEYINFLNLNNLIEKSYISYLCMMSIRIHYMYKLLKNTGSFYLHCDPTMSHYLKIVLDFIFGKENFRNEIIWYYSNKQQSITKKQFLKSTDIIFFYTKGLKNTFNLQYSNMNNSRGSQIRKLGYNKRTIKGKKCIDVYNWDVYNKLITSGKIDNNIETRNLSQKENIKYLDNCFQIPIINSQAKERLGYPTQKPEALLERIIKASSNENDLVADFFCGCGTTVSVASRLKRKFIGCDISLLSISLIEKRLIESGFKDFKVEGIPKDIASLNNMYNELHLKDLNKEEISKRRFKFEEYVMTYLLKGIKNNKKTGQGKYHDGRLIIEHDKEIYTLIVEIKSGKVTLNDIKAFSNDLIELQQEHNKIYFGVLIAFKENLKERKEKTQLETTYFKGNKFIPILEIKEIEEFFEDNKYKQTLKLLVVSENISTKKSSDKSQKEIL